MFTYFKKWKKWPDITVLGRLGFSLTPAHSRSKLNYAPRKLTTLNMEWTVKRFSQIRVKCRYNCPYFTSFIIVNPNHKVLVKGLTGQENVPDYLQSGTL